MEARIFEIFHFWAETWFFFLKDCRTFPHFKICVSAPGIQTLKGDWWWRELQDQACPKYLDGLRIVDFPTKKWKNIDHNSFHRKFFEDEMLLLYSSNIISCFLFIYFNILVKYAILYCLVYLNLCNLQRRNQCPRLQKIHLDDERCVYLFAFP